MFGQTFEPHDLIVVGVLIILEGVLSIDNALVLGLLARQLPKPLQSRALTFGLVGAFAFRIIAILTASFLLRWRIVKLLGGGYLVWVAFKHFFLESKSHAHEKVALDSSGNPITVDADTGKPIETAVSDVEPKFVKALHADIEHTRSTHSKGFWIVVAEIELTDIAFAIDSILAAIALVGSRPKDHPEDSSHPKMWVVITGGMLGVILMRFAAVMFIKLLEKFPRFETAAYLLVTVIGLKLVVDWWLNAPDTPDRANFHSPDAAAFWIFWIAMLACFCIGFFPQRKKVLATDGAQMDTDQRS